MSLDAEDLVVLADDNQIIPADILAAIQAGDAYPETTGFSTTVEFIDFESHGKPFTQVLTILRPHTPRLHKGKEILVVAGEGGKDNGNGFIETYEKISGMAPFLAARGVTVAIVPRLGRWNFFDEGGSWKDIPLGERMPVFTRHQAAYWSPGDYTSHASKGQASDTGSDTYRLPVAGTALYDHMLAATPDTLVEGYRQGAQRALEIIGKPRDDIMMLYWGFSTGGPFLWALNRYLTADGMLGWGTSNNPMAYLYSRAATGHHDWPYEDSCLRVRERGRPDFHFYTRHISDELREEWFQESLHAPNFKSIEDAFMHYNVAALTEHSTRLWESGFLPEEDRKGGFAKFIAKILEPCFPADELRHVAVWEMNGTLDQVIQPAKVDAARLVTEPYCKRYRVTRLDGYYHDVLHDTCKTVARIWFKAIDSGHFD
ncbi:MAG: hypothetical protein HOM58_07410 [Rhodospirillaceae bacterium]|nr:hypothetical protein [Rhodospirillaceae bacterium]MBT5458489.1 hypothetical protein [Rhodospirillaceae bacterium]